MKNKGSRISLLALLLMAIAITVLADESDTPCNRCCNVGLNSQCFVKYQAPTGTMERGDKIDVTECKDSTETVGGKTYDVYKVKYRQSNQVVVSSMPIEALRTGSAKTGICTCEDYTLPGKCNNNKQMCKYQYDIFTHSNRYVLVSDAGCTVVTIKSAMTLSEISSKTTGTVGGDDTVWIRARTSSAVGASVSQFGQPGFLSFVSHSAKTVTAEGQEITVAYKCVAPGNGIPFSMWIFTGGEVRIIRKLVTCNQNPANVPRFGEVNSVTTGSVGEFVFIRVRAINAVGASIVNYGAPGFLAFQDKSAKTITGSDQEVLVRYKCAAAGSNLEFNVRLSLNGRQVGIVAKKVSCLGLIGGNDRLEWISNDASGTAGSGSDTVSITAAALDANGDMISQFGQPGYLIYVSQTARYVTSNYQTVTVTYRCTSVGSNIPFSVQLVKNGKVISWVTRPVTCKGLIGGTYMQELSSDVSGTVGATDTVSINARVVGGRTLIVGQYGQPGILQYVTRSASTITQDSQDVSVTYKCVGAGTVTLELYVHDGSQKIARIAKTVTCR